MMFLLRRFLLFLRAICWCIDMLPVVEEGPTFEVENTEDCGGPGNNRENGEELELAELGGGGEAEPTEGYKLKRLRRFLFKILWRD